MSRVKLLSLASSLKNESKSYHQELSVANPNKNKNKNQKEKLCPRRQVNSASVDEREVIGDAVLEKDMVNSR